ncbi:TIGR00270 family protein [Candidatus Woesearchaeota archaeon]|nr:MAG: TIGR00270 family protein [Candidatus Woesearchaeota archaeon]
MQCEMCGEERPLYATEIEGTVLNVCKSCSSYGKVVRPLSLPKPKAAKSRVVKKEAKKEEPEIIQSIVEDYHVRIKRAREKRGWKQEELAKKIAEKESVIHKLESKHMEPSIKLAEKLEHALGIKLVVEEEAPKIAIERSRGDTITLGDVIKIRKKKR